MIPELDNKKWRKIFSYFNSYFDRVYGTNTYFHSISGAKKDRIGIKNVEEVFLLAATKQGNYVGIFSMKDGRYVCLYVTGSLGPWSRNKTCRAFCATTLVELLPVLKIDLKIFQTIYHVHYAIHDLLETYNAEYVP